MTIMILVTKRTHKKCSKCKKIKEKNKFNNSSSSKDGVQSWCKSCQKGRKKIDYHKLDELFKIKLGAIQNLIYDTIKTFEKHKLKLKTELYGFIVNEIRIKMEVDFITAEYFIAKLKRYFIAMHGDTEKDERITIFLNTKKIKLKQCNGRICNGVYLSFVHFTYRDDDKCKRCSKTTPMRCRSQIVMPILEPKIINTDGYSKPEKDTNVKVKTIFIKKEHIDNSKKIIAAYNSLCFKLKPCTCLSIKRRKAITKFWNKCIEEGFEPMETFLSIFKWINKSSFHCGYNDYDWEADLDYILKPSKFKKIISKIMKVEEIEKIKIDKHNKFIEEIAYNPFGKRTQRIKLKSNTCSTCIEWMKDNSSDKGICKNQIVNPFASRLINKGFKPERILFFDSGFGCLLYKPKFEMDR